MKNAILERILDSGWHIIQAVNNETGLAEACIWAAFCLVTPAGKNDAIPALVANYYEMAPDQCRNVGLSEPLMTQLTEYAHSFSDELGIPYLIRPLTYGLLMDYFETSGKDPNLEKIRVDSIEKLGGDLPGMTYYFESRQEIREFFVRKGSINSNGDPLFQKVKSQ